jgi:predicted MFS family arabinose efflux permease
MARLRSDEKMARKAGWASFIGTTIEWYDFYIYGFASALVFGPLFFSNVPDEIGVLLSFVTFWAGFLARPIGAMVFGHIGDRIGRKRALIATLMLMGVSTVGIGLLPTHAQIGALAPILLTLFRVVQGLAVGGEWGGAVLIATEHAKKERGYLFGAFAQQGSPAGRILATVSFIGVAKLPEEALLDWAWRVPFLASAVLVIVGLVIRLRLEESPAVAELRASNQTARVPLVDLFRAHSKTVLVGLGAVLIVFTVAYGRDTFALSWVTSEGHMTEDDFLTIILIASVVQFFVQPFGAVLATRWGARKAATLLLTVQLPMLPLMFVLLGTGNWTLGLAGAVLATVPDVMFYAFMAGMLAQAFPANVRYTGIAAIYGLTGAIGGAVPVIMQSLFTTSGSIVLPIAFTVLLGAISLVSTRAFITISARREAALHASERPGLAAERVP